MSYFAVQYLEDSPDIASITPDQARAKLRDAFTLLPINLVLLGWHLPDAIVNACREETRQANARLYRWHPLLTGDGELMPRPEWQTIGLRGEVVAGFQNMPEFTFICPNRPAVREAVRAHLHALIQRGEYDGIFLDRMRFPSPAADPSRWLACFCPDCQRVAATDHKLDLEAARRSIQRLLQPQQLPAFVQALLNPAMAEATNADIALFKAFLAFRAQSITNFIHTVADLIHGEGLAVGLDCFSPALTQMVGQDLTALEHCADWTKVMTYCHTLGPAGLPFELLDLANWLVEQRQLNEATALTWLAQATGLVLPGSRAELRQTGLPPLALKTEMARARAAGVKQLWAGVELVEIPSVAHLEPKQIAADQHALSQTDINGLVLSWDLWQIPNERLQLVHSIWS